MELEKPRVTEILVRMDCNGCVQKIKKALQGINGIYDLYIDFPKQKLTVVGWADPEKIVRAIKKTRKIATICSHTAPSDPPAEPTEPAPEAAPPAPENANPPPAEPTPPEEPPKDPPPPENPTPSPPAPDNQPPHPSGPKDVSEIHLIHHHQNDYNYSQNVQYHGPPQGHGYYNSYPIAQGYRQEAPTSYPIAHAYRQEAPVYATHSYNTYRPSPYIAEYEYVRSPPRPHYSRMEQYSEEYHNRGSSSNGNNITSMFSDENPNACRII